MTLTWLPMARPRSDVDMEVAGSWRQHARRHRAFYLVLSLAVAMRVLTEVAYWPAVLFPDSGSYLTNAQRLTPGLWHPAGYPLLLRLLSVTGSLATVTIVQHLFGLACVVVVYLLLRRLQIRGWVAALAASPFALDPMQLNLEQYVLSDTLFGLLIVLALALALWRPPTVLLAATVCVVVAYATMVRTVAVVVMIPIAIYWLLRRARPQVLVAAAAALVLPLAGYAVRYHHYHGSFGLQAFSGRWLYGRVSSFANCAGDGISRREQPLCPALPVAQRPGPSQYVWDSHLQYFSVGVPRNPITRSQVAGRFAMRIIVAQPLDYAATVSHDLLHAFAPGRNTDPRQWFAGSWYFYLPHEPPYWRTRMAAIHYGGRLNQPHLNLTAARALHRYEQLVYVSGPIGAAALLLAVAGAVWGRRARGAILMFLTSGLLLLVAPILTVGFDYRYVLEALQLIVVASAIGGTVLLERLGSGSGLARLRRRGMAVAGAAAALGVVGVNSVVPEAYASGTYTPATLRPAGATVYVHGRYAVALGRPAVTASCQAGRVRWIVTAHAGLTWLAGAPILAAQDNFTVVSGHRVVGLHAVSHPDPRVLNPVVLSRAHRSTDGLIRFQLEHDPEPLTVTYTDPLGAGAAGWRMTLPGPSAQLPALSSPCVPTVAGGPQTDRSSR